MKPKKNAPTQENLIELWNDLIEGLELTQGNPFKVRAHKKALAVVEGLDETEFMTRVKDRTLTELAGIGKGTSDLIIDYFACGQLAELNEIQKSVSPFFRELAGVSGVGAAKARVLIEQLKIESLGELEYACKENRLLNLKGFGEKSQAKILHAIQFMHAAKGLFRLGDVFETSRALFGRIEHQLAEWSGVSNEPLRVTEVGALRRRAEVLRECEFLVELPEFSEGNEGNEGNATKKEAFISEMKKLEKFDHSPSETSAAGCQFKIHFAESARFSYEAARMTATSEHWMALGSPEFSASTLAKGSERSNDRLNLLGQSAQVDEHLYVDWLGGFVPPEARETGEEVQLVKEKGSEFERSLLGYGDLKGVFHLHTTYSDGKATLEEMIKEAIRFEYEYIGISDHSQSAFYAGGLGVEKLKNQFDELEQLRLKYPQIRIFWGVESDILANGDLDYDDEILAKFDFVIASIHQRFSHQKQQMTDRILRAVENKHTRFIGHVTGRLLLERASFDCDLEKIIESCAKNKVILELNANPYRLDVDWRFGPVLRKTGCLISVNPDAHALDGYQDTQFGIAMARKALVSKSQVFNAGSVAAVESWFKKS